MGISLATTLRKNKFLSGNLEESTTSHFQLPDTVHHGWNSDKSILWVINIFPVEIESILLDSCYDLEDVNDTLGDSDDEEIP